MVLERDGKDKVGKVYVREQVTSSSTGMKDFKGNEATGLGTEFEMEEGLNDLEI